MGNLRAAAPPGRACPINPMFGGVALRSIPMFGTIAPIGDLFGDALD
jgi:hypothetical protein